jgi:hypothetical protein
VKVSFVLRRVEMNKIQIASELVRCAKMLVGVADGKTLLKNLDDMGFDKKFIDIASANGFVKKATDSYFASKKNYLTNENFFHDAMTLGIPHAGEAFEVVSDGGKVSVDDFKKVMDGFAAALKSMHKEYHNAKK